MSDLYDDNDDSNLVKDLRKQLEAAKKAQAEQEKSLAELRGAARQRTLAEVLTSKGVNPKVAKLIPSDIEGDEAVTKWLDDYAEVFGVKAEPAVEEDDLAAMRDVQNLTATGTAQTPTRLKADEAYLNEATTPEEWRDRAKAIKAGVAIDPNA